MTEQHRSCTEKVYIFVLYYILLFNIDSFIKHKQKIHIYHCCMLCLTDPGALFKVGVLKKVWFRPQVGNFLLFSPLRFVWWFTAAFLLTNFASMSMDLFLLLDGRYSHSFYPRGSQCHDCFAEKKRASVGYASVSRRGTRHQDTLSPLLSPNRKLKKSGKQRGSLTSWGWVVTACPTFRKTKRLPTLPRWFPSAESAQCAEEQRTVRGCEEGGCCVHLSEFRPVFHTPCVTITQVTAGPGTYCVS